MWVWLYQNWIQDQEEEHKKYRDYSIFLGSFYNYEMAKHLSGQGVNTKQSSDKDFEESLRQVEEWDKIERTNEDAMSRRRRKIIR